MRRHWKLYLLALGFLLGAISNALAEGPINARGDIVGRYVADGVSHAYLLSGGQFSTIDFPGATFTSADAMNQRGDILGRYTLDGVTHGYVLVGFRPPCN